MSPRDWRTLGDYFPCTCGHAQVRHRVTGGKFECSSMRDDATVCSCPAFVPAHHWEVDEDGVCEYDQGYLCACGARKVVMAEGDTKHTPESQAPCPLLGAT